MSFTRAVTSRPARLAANLGLIQLALFLPFLPGRHDVLAPALSGMAQLIGTAGLVLLVPAGAAWWFRQGRHGQITTGHQC